MARLKPEIEAYADVDDLHVNCGGDETGLGLPRGEDGDLAGGARHRIREPVEDEVAVDDVDGAGDFESRAVGRPVERDLQGALPLRAEVVVQLTDLARHRGDVARLGGDARAVGNDLDRRRRQRRIALDRAVDSLGELRAPWR